MYEITNILKHAEEDIFEHGCQPGTGTGNFIDISFKSRTVKDLIEQAAEFLDCQDFQLNACEEIGRLDFQKHETFDGTTPTEAELERWKEGKLKLWLVDYSMWVEKVTRRKVDLAARTRMPKTEAA